ncbi:MAG: MBL fold metallo-hydrolase [Tenuifilaceae bacterium]
MKTLIFIAYSLLFSITGIVAQNDIKVVCQTSGPFNVNSYLIFDQTSKEAAFIDVGSAIDSLILRVAAESLNVKYIFLTHAHQDHIASLNELEAKYPKAKVCYCIDEYEDFKQYKRWKDIFDIKSVKSWQKDPAMETLMNFNYDNIQKPNIYLENDKTFKIGKSKLRVIKTPGHSRGSLSYTIENMVFPGDLILYNSTGYLDYLLCSKDDIVKSIRLLYGNLPDETIIYSGHGKLSTIGYEKVNNKTVTNDLARL